MESRVRGELNTDGVSDCQTLAEGEFEGRNRQASLKNIYAVYRPFILAGIVVPPCLRLRYEKLQQVPLDLVRV
jgi:hypothetical protein